MKHPPKLTPMRIAVLISVMVNLALLVWFVGSDLRHEKVTVVIEPKPELTEEQREELERKRRDRPVRMEEIERVEKFVEEQKLEAMEKNVLALEELKKRMEALVDNKFQELEDFTPEQIENFHRLAYDQIHRETVELRRNMGDSREAIERDRENRSWQVQRLLQLEDISTDMEAYQDHFITATREAAEKLRDNPDSLSDEEEATVVAFAGRAEALAERAEFLKEKFEQLKIDGPRGFFEPGVALAELSPEDRSDMTAGDLHEYAKRIESALFEDFATHQAIDLLAVAGDSIVDVLDATTVTPPPRSDLSEELSREGPGAGGVAAFQNYHHALETAARETGQMRLSSQGRLRDAEARGGGDEERARALMEARQAAIGNMTQPSEKPAGKPGASGDGTGGAGMGGGPQADVLDARASGMEDDLRDETPTLSAHEVFRNAIPGRRFDSKTDRQGWIFLDTWYLIGPWERPHGPAFRQPLPPEIQIDFDATYPGKVVQGEQTHLRWRFLQSNSIQINPYDPTQNAVYFAFTEVYAEEEMDVLLAFAADDEARLWVNEILIYESTGHHAWRMDQNFTRILLRRGYNTVLVRLENGPDVTHFSVLLTPPGSIPGD